MIALKIIDVKSFMNKLLIGKDFDPFYLVEASITTFNHFSIDGRLHPDYFDTDIKNIMEQQQMLFSPWKEVKPWCYSVIRGKHTPLSFIFLFRFPKAYMDSFSRQIESLSHIPELESLTIHIQYKNGILMVINGISFRNFYPEKRPEQLWDTMFQDYFRRQEIPFEILTHP